MIELFGYSKKQFLEKEVWEIGFFKDIVVNKVKFLDILHKEHVSYEDIPLETADGRRINVEFVSNAYKVDRNQVIQCNIRDITERIQTKKRRAFVTSILSILNRPNNWKLLVKNILEEIKKFTGVEAVGIRLKEGEDYPYIETIGFPDSFIEMENYLCARDVQDKIIYDSEGKSHLECMCGNIISERTDPSLPFFTHGGSFWSNSTTKLLTSTSEKDRPGHTSNRCNARRV